MIVSLLFKQILISVGFEHSECHESLQGNFIVVLV